MGNSDLKEEAIATLSREQLIEELTRLGLPIEGSNAILAARLLIYSNRSQVSYATRDADEAAIRLRIPSAPTEPVKPGSQNTRNSSRTSTSYESGHTSIPANSTPISLGAYARTPPSRTSPSNASAAYNIIRKWDLKFSGARGEDAEAFLIRIEEGRELMPVTDDEILRCLPFCLTGIALNWYRSKRAQLSNWDDFKYAWRTRFGDPDFQFTLRHEIMRRTQGERESVADYLTCMISLFDRLSPRWSEYEKLDYAYRNMLPRLQITVRRDEVRDLDQLEILATRAECSLDATTRYRPPPTPEKSLFPDLAYRAPRGGSKNLRETMATLDIPGEPANKGGRANKTPKRQGNPEKGDKLEKASRVKSMKCWNCSRMGHLSRDCPEEAKVHCYKCGKAEVTTRTCPDCSGNE